MFNLEGIAPGNNVRFGSLADICGANVRFAPIATAKAELLQKVMSALPPKADMYGANRNVGYGPEADACNKISEDCALKQARC